MRSPHIRYSRTFSLKVTRTYVHTLNYRIVHTYIYVHQQENEEIEVKRIIGYAYWYDKGNVDKEVIKEE